MHENEISEELLDAAIMVHRELGGPGLLESVYEEALSFELDYRGLNVDRQLVVPIKYREYELSAALRLDMLIENKVIVECKAVEEYNKIFNVQVLTYLRLTKLKLGIVINFGAPVIKDGFHRVLNGYLS